MIKLFFDTNILVSATFWQGASYTLLFSDDVIGYTSGDILREYRLVLKRDFDLSEDEIDARLQVLLELLILVSPSKRLNIIHDDQDDNRVLEGAVEAKVEYIVSYDAHILKLKEFEGIRIVKPNILIASQ
jgi:putative PIN family toxin of toxin-antitoxin system